MSSPAGGEFRRRMERKFFIQPRHLDLARALSTPLDEAERITRTFENRPRQFELVLESARDVV